ncbi:hypothetical protein ACP70R_018727 [Stipagrostis hirtigluma subsp. patula]
MAIPLVLVVLPLGLLFLLSGLIVNAIQAVLFVSIRPFSKSFYRRINRFLAELLWLQLVWLVDWWAGVKVQLHADPETYKLMGKEHALIISNHRSDIDWLIGWILAQRSGCLGSTLAIMKKSSKFLPVIGWSMWFAEYLFLERSWAKDEKTLKWGLQRLKDFPRSFWLALFVEGTRFTPAKLLAAQEYAASQGLPAPRNVLIPRTKSLDDKSPQTRVVPIFGAGCMLSGLDPDDSSLQGDLGFVSAVSIMRDFVPAIYDTTVIIPKDSPAPTMLRILKGQSSVVHVRIKRHAMSDMPKSDEDVSKWCKDIFVAKDALLDKHIATGAFDEEIRPIGRPMKSLLCGSVLVLPPPIWCLQILTVDSAVVDMERRYRLCFWTGTGDRYYACLHHVLSVRAFELCQSSKESSEERLMALDSICRGTASHYVPNLYRHKLDGANLLYALGTGDVFVWQELWPPTLALYSYTSVDLFLT